MHRKSILNLINRPSYSRWSPAYRTSLTLLVVAAALTTGCDKPKPVELPLQIVLTEKVEQKVEPVYMEWIGTLTGSVNASIRAQVGGYLIKQLYTEGSNVKAGDVLFQIDPRPYQASVDQAKGNLASAQATQLKSQQDMERYKGLVASGAVSQQEYQNEVQVNDANIAQVTAMQGALQLAQLNLGYTEIKSAVDGVAGIAEAQVGDLIGQNTEMTTVSTIDPIKAVFNVSEQLYLNFMMEHPELAQQEQAQKNAVLQLLLSDGLPYAQKGTLDIINRQVNQQTGTIQLIGLFPNAQGVLRPGSFVRVRMSGKKQQATIRVPQQAVTQLQTVYVMAVVTPDADKPTEGTVKIVIVQVGNQIGNQWVITSGLNSGDMIVVEGGDKVKDGQKVTIKPFVAPVTAAVPASTNAAPVAGQ